MSLILPGTAASSRLRSGGSSPYVAKAVHFDGNTWLSVGTGIAPDSSKYSFSLWFKGDLSSYTHTLSFFDIDPVNAEFGVFLHPSSQDPPYQFTIECILPGGSTQFWVKSNGNLLPNSTEWHHLFGYIDSIERTGAILLDGTDETLELRIEGDPFEMLFSSSGWAIPDSTDDYPTPELIGDYADVWLAPGVYETDITIFRDPINGKPVDPSSFPASAVLFSGDSSTFAVNQGTGGAFTLTGSLTNASTSPSD